MRRVVGLAIFALGCVADPTSNADLAASTDAAELPDAATTDLPDPPASLSWTRSQNGITGIWATSLVADASHFYVYGNYDGVYQIPATGAPSAVRLFDGPVSDYGRLMAVAPDGALVVTTYSSGTLERTLAAPDWSTYLKYNNISAAVFGDRSYVIANATLYRSASLTPPGTFSALTALPATPVDTLATSIVGGKWRVYILYQQSLHYVEPATSATLVDKSTPFSTVTALGGGSRTLVAGVRTADGAAGVTQLTAGGNLVDCGNPLPTTTHIATVLSTPTKNYAITTDYHLYVNSGCAGDWSMPGAALDAILAGFAATTDVANQDTLAVATTVTVIRSSNGGASWEDTAIPNSSVTITALARDPADATHLFAGTSARGAFLSSDGGAHWSLITGLPVNNVEWSGDFVDADTLWLAGHCLSLSCTGGGLYRGTRDNNGTFVFTRSGPFTSAAGVVTSPVVGTVACVYDPQPLRRLVGDSWQVVASPSDMSCAGPFLSRDGTTVFAGHLAGKITVLADATATPIARSAPVDSLAKFIVSIDGSNDHLLVGTTSGLYRVEPSLAGEILFSGAGLGVIDSLYDDAGRLWVAADNEPLLVSTDRGVTWERVGATTGMHPLLTTMVRTNGDLVGGSVAGMWRATLF